MERCKCAEGLEDFRFHDLRHEAVSRFVEAALSNRDASALRGHKSKQMFKRYTQLRAKDSIQKLDKVTRSDKFDPLKITKQPISGLPRSMSHFYTFSKIIKTLKNRNQISNADSKASGDNRAEQNLSWKG
ncbi:tyrosine-type recombinase/integrase [Achromobacter mucicolens]|uniref:tyrosine-type recombinase/integrase n=1 Tax=Achromobacter mucicolens TaxID=1389922 RepID=UPI003464B061